MQHRIRLLQKTLLAANRVGLNANATQTLRTPPRIIPQLMQCYGTKSKPPGTYDEPLDFFADPENTHLRDELYSPEGKKLLTVEADQDFDKMDWGEFERIFAIDSTTDEEIDAGWEELKTKFHIRDTPVKTKRKRTRFARPKVVVANETDTENNDVEEGPSLQFNNLEADKSLSAGKQEMEEQWHTVSPSEPLDDQPAILNGGLPKQFSDPDAFQQPINKKRPGFERRVMSMEAEMEKIVVDVLCKGNPVWSTEGADVERVLLSPNMKNLTVYYTLDDSSYSNRKRWWKRTNAKFESAVRAALARELHIRYAPQVHFERLKTTSTSPETKGELSEIEKLFEQIEEERVEMVKEAGIIDWAKIMRKH